MSLYNWSRITNFSYSQIRDIQSKKLRYLLNQLVPYSPFYSQLYRSQNIDLKNIRSIDDITKLPFSEKKDLLPTSENPGKAKEFILQPTTELVMQTIPLTKKLGFLSKKIIGHDPKADIEYEFRPVHLHFTTGRSASQIPFAYSKRDLDVLGQTGSRLLTIIGAKTTDSAVNCFPYAPHLAFWFTTYAAKDFGLLCLHTGGGKMMGTQKIIESIEKLKPSILVFIPSYAYHLLREAESQKRNFSSIKKLFLAAKE